MSPPLPRRRAAVALALLRFAVRESAPLKSTRDTRNGKKKGGFRHLGCYSKVHDVAACMLASTRSVKRRDEWSLRLAARSVLSAPYGGRRGRCFSRVALFTPIKLIAGTTSLWIASIFVAPRSLWCELGGYFVQRRYFSDTMLSTLIESRTTTTFHAMSIIK